MGDAAVPQQPSTTTEEDDDPLSPLPCFERAKHLMDALRAETMSGAETEFMYAEQAAAVEEYLEALRSGRRPAVRGNRNAVSCVDRNDRMEDDEWSEGEEQS